MSSLSFVGSHDPLSFKYPAIRHALILHSSYLDVNGQALLFSGPSGIGKSTQADLWVRHRGAAILNGDKSLLIREPDGWYAHGWPICGSSGICRNESRRIRAIVMLGCGALLYWLGVRLMCSLKGINLAMDSYNSVEQEASRSIFGRIGRVYQTWAWAFWNPAHAHIEAPVLVLNILLAALGLWGLLTWLRKGRAGGTEKLLLCLLVVLLPVGMNTAQLSFSGDAHDLMKYSFWLFYVLCLLPCFIGTRKKADRTSGVTRWIGAVLVLTLLCANIQTANVVYTKKQLEQEGTRSLMTRVLMRLEEREDYVPGETPLVFAGVSDQLQEKIPGFEAYYDITGCETASPIVKSTASYNYNIYAAYFRYLLNNPAVMADWELWNRMQEDPRVAELPTYPAEGCMQLVDGVMVVRMGKDRNDRA